jgi:hypothetical protein
MRAPTRAGAVARREIIATVDSRPILERLDSLEVSGITTNDPRLFAPAGIA